MRPLLKVAIAIVAIELLAAVLAPWISPYDPLKQDVIARLKGPSLAHWLGTDQFGRDILSRVLHGARASLSIAILAVGIALAVAAVAVISFGPYLSGR